jgi:CxxC motif-containing protein (DUF1111 family)
MNVMRWPTLLICGTAALASAALHGTEVGEGERASQILAFSSPRQSLSDQQLMDFALGRSLMNSDWQESSGSLAGLGPFFGARSCATCHPFDGKGARPVPGRPEFLGALVVGQEGPTGHQKNYGRQLHCNAVGRLKPEGCLTVTYTEIKVDLSGRESIIVHKPFYRAVRLGYGPLPGNADVNVRTAPAIVGLGLLQDVPLAELRRAIAEFRLDPTVHGHFRFTDIEQGEIGRFGSKAEHATLENQVAYSLLEEMGLTSQAYPKKDCYVSHRCEAATRNVSALQMANFVTYLSFLNPPPISSICAGPCDNRGSDVFKSIGCADCHLPEMRAVVQVGARLPEEKVHPFTDLQLHDMGEGLADKGSGSDRREWRTTPLWGLGSVGLISPEAGYLHDGRATSISEAVWWHDGEARHSRDAFLALEPVDRKALLSYLSKL